MRSKTLNEPANVTVHTVRVYSNEFCGFDRHIFLKFDIYYIICYNRKRLCNIFVIYGGKI